MRSGCPDHVGTRQTPKGDQRPLMTTTHVYGSHQFFSASMSVDIDWVLIRFWFAFARVCRLNLYTVPQPALCQGGASDCHSAFSCQLAQTRRINEAGTAPAGTINSLSVRRAEMKADTLNCIETGANEKCGGIPLHIVALAAGLFPTSRWLWTV